MLAAIQNYLRDEKITPPELTEMMFIDTQFESIKADEMKAFEQYENLEFVNFAECGVKSIEAPFPALLKCGALLFSNNALSNDAIGTVVNLANLESLAFDGNQITSLDNFSLLAGLSKLREISLADCPVAQEDGYREKLFSLLPQVQIIDDVDREGNVIELDESEDEFDSEDSDISDDGEGSEDFAGLEDIEGSEDGEDDDEDDDDEDDEDEEDEDEEFEKGSEDEPSVKKTRNA